MQEMIYCVEQKSREAKLAWWRKEITHHMGSTAMEWVPMMEQ